MVLKYCILYPILDCDWSESADSSSDCRAYFNVLVQTGSLSQHTQGLVWQGFINLCGRSLQC